MCRRHKLMMSLVVLTWTASVYQVSYSFIYSSTTKIEEMALEEEQILNGLYAAVQEVGNQTMVSYFSKFYQERLPKARERRQEVHLLEYVRHPNGAYNIIRQFAADYENIRSTLSVAHSSSILYYLNSIATEEDVQGVLQSFIHLQDVYNLTVSDMVKGNYFGFAGPQLTEADIADIGEAAFNDNRWQYAISWLQEALNLSTPEQPTCVLSFLDAPRISEGRILALIGRSYLRLGNNVKAKELYKKALIASAATEPDSQLSQLEKELSVKPHIPKTYQTDENFRRLCHQHNKQTLKKFDPRISCSYKEGVLPYYRIKQELLSVSPYVTLFYDVITDKEIDGLIEITKAKLIRGTRQLDGVRSVDSHRTSHVAFLGDWQLPDVIVPLTLRMAAITNLNIANYVPGGSYSAEHIQVANYGMGGQYGLHHDYFAQEILGKEFHNKPESLYGGDRLATFLIYMTDVERGGSTVFNQVELAVRPVKLNFRTINNTSQSVTRSPLSPILFNAYTKMAVFWYNFKPSGELDTNTRHAGCPVVVGNKWVSNKWIWIHGNAFTRRCGLTPNATQLDIEPYMRKRWV